MSEMDKRHHRTFESMRREDEDGAEYWSGRELQAVLEYSSWQRFNAVIHKAIQACSNAKIDPSDHFNHVVKMVTVGSGARRKVADVRLSRYELMMNSRKVEVEVAKCLMEDCHKKFTATGHTRH